MADSYKSLLFKKEAVYGADSAPTSLANFALTRVLSVKPLAVDQIDRNLDIPARGARKSAPTNKRQEISYELELAGSGVAGTAPAWMEHLECCGMTAPVLAVGVDAKQKFEAIGNPLSSATVHVYLGGNQRRRGRGARGTITAINFTAGQYPFIGISLVALLAAAPFDQSALAAPDIDRWGGPQEVSTGNTSFTLDGYAAVMRSFVLQDDAEVVLRNLVGANYVLRGNYALKGKIVIETPDHNTKDYLSRLSSGATVAAQLIHGVGAGNIIQIDAPTVQITDITDSEENNVAMYEIDVLLTITVGQDDILITAK
jgi:hypothetical protein